MSGQTHGAMSLAYVPPGVAAAVFCHLSSFSDVFALAATCRALHVAWYLNTTYIFQCVAPRSIPHLALAKALLDQQRGSGGQQLSAEDTRRVVRNAHKAEKSAVWFGREIAPHAHCGKWNNLVVALGHFENHASLLFFFQPWS
jgi:hypothetical protein